MLVNNSRTMLKRARLIRNVLFSPFRLALLFLAMLFGSGPQCLAQTGADTSKTLSSAEIARIIKSFTTKEAQFRRALNEYVFRRDALVQSVGMGGQITGEYHRVSNYTFRSEERR